MKNSTNIFQKIFLSDSDVKDFLDAISKSEKKPKDPERLFSYIVRNARYREAKKARFYRGRKFRENPESVLSKKLNVEEGISEYATNLKNVFYSVIHKVFIDKDRSKISINSPWIIKDSLGFFKMTYNTAFPYKWQSTIKIQDAAGKDVCLVHHNNRGMASIIAFAPDLFKFCVSIYLNKDELFSEEAINNPKFKFIFSYLERIVSILMVSYDYSEEFCDGELIYKQFIEESFTGVMKVLCQKEHEDLVSEFLISHDMELNLQEKIYKVLSSKLHGILLRGLSENTKEHFSDSLLLESVELWEKVKYSERLVGDDLKEYIESFLQNNIFAIKFQKKETNKNTEDYGNENISDSITYSPIYDLTEMFSYFSISDIHNIDSNHLFDIVTCTLEKEKSLRAKRIRNDRSKILKFTADELDALLVSIGIGENQVARLSVVVKERLLSELVNNTDYEYDGQFATIDVVRWLWREWRRLRAADSPTQEDEATLESIDSMLRALERTKDE